jgi:hypothetical protein
MSRNDGTAPLDVGGFRFRESAMGCGGSKPKPQRAAELGGYPQPVEVSGVSVYNESYQCTVVGCLVAKDCVNITVSAAGDGSDGPLQNAIQSHILITRPDGSSETVDTTMTQEGWEGSAPNSDNAWNGILYYPVGGILAHGCTVSFTFGAPGGGYSTVQLFTVDDALADRISLEKI